MKASSQLFGAVMAAIMPLVLTNQALSVTEWINVGVVGAGAATVWIASNHPTGVWSYTKTFMSLISAAGVALISILADGSFSQAEWWQLLTALLTAFAVLETPKLSTPRHEKLA